MNVTITFTDEETNFLYSIFSWYLADLNLTIQDDPRDYGIQKKYKQLCQLRDKVEVALNAGK